MGNRRLNKAECIHILGTLEFERLKVSALNLFHPTASPPFPKSWFPHIVTQPLDGECQGGVDNETLPPSSRPSPFKGEGRSGMMREQVTKWEGDESLFPELREKKKRIIGAS